jgi:hypothetical protein
MSAAAGGRYRRVRSAIWLEREFAALSEHERLVALYCLTGPYTNGLGLYRLVPEAAAVDLGIGVDAFRRRFKAPCRAFRWRFDGAARVLWIPTWLEENAPQSPNVVKSWRAAFNEVPACAVKIEASRAIRAFLKAKGEAFHEAFGEVSTEAPPEAVSFPFGIRDQEQEPFRKSEQEPSGKNTHAFIKRFCELYSQHRNGASYLVRKARDVPNVRALLHTYPLERLEAMAELLMTIDDEWIAGTDRGIGILTTKATWLDDRIISAGHNGPDPWARILEALMPCIERNAFNVWFQSATFVREDGNAIVVAVEGQHHKARIQEFAAEFERAKEQAAVVKPVHFHVRGGTVPGAVHQQAFRS